MKRGIQKGCLAETAAMSLGWHPIFTAAKLARQPFSLTTNSQVGSPTHGHDAPALLLTPTRPVLRDDHAYLTHLVHTPLTHVHATAADTSASVMSLTHTAVHALP